MKQINKFGRTQEVILEISETSVLFLGSCGMGGGADDKQGCIWGRAPEYPLTCHSQIKIISLANGKNGTYVSIMVPFIPPLK